MAKPFDATIKHLVETHPMDWLNLAGLPFSGPVEIIDADLSAVSAESSARNDSEFIQRSSAYERISHLSGYCGRRA
jgi:hypothetical protein